MALSNNLKNILTGILIVVPLALLSYFYGPQRLPQREEKLATAIYGVIIEKSRAQCPAFIVELRPGVEERFACIQSPLWENAQVGDTIIKIDGSLNCLLIHNGDTATYNMFRIW